MDHMKEELALLQPVLESKSVATAELLKKVWRASVHACRLSQLLLP